MTDSIHATNSPALVTDEIVNWVNARWTPEMGAIDGHDIQFIATLIDEARPRNVVEIGCASGFSTAVLSMILNQVGACTLDSFDLMDRFYARPELPVGYLLGEIDDTPKVCLKVHSGTVSLDIAGALEGGPIDFCFIDANHSHPWPIIDTLAVLPMMKPGSYLVHHDLKMYQGGLNEEYATGPKVLLDQTPVQQRIWFDMRGDPGAPNHMATRHIDGNIFAIRIPEDIRPLAWSLSQGFMLAWDPIIHTYFDDHFASRLQRFLNESYAPDISRAFEIGNARYRSLLPRHVQDPESKQQVTGFRKLVQRRNLDSV